MANPFGLRRHVSRGAGSRRRKLALGRPWAIVKVFFLWPSYKMAPREGDQFRVVFSEKEVRMTRSRSSGGEPRAERRASPRRAVDLLANRFSRGEPHLVRVVDVSATGLRASGLGPGSPPEAFGGLQLQLPGDDAVLTASTETVAVDEAGLRLRFTRLSPDSRERLARFVGEPGVSTRVRR